MTNRTLDSYSVGELERIVIERESEIKNIKDFIESATQEIGVTTRYVVHSDWMDHRIIVNDLFGFELVSQDRRYGTDYEVKYKGSSVLSLTSELTIDHIKPGEWQEEFKKLMGSKDEIFSRYKNLHPELEDQKIEEKYRMKRENDSYYHDLEMRARHIRRNREADEKNAKVIEEERKRKALLEKADKLKL